MKRLTHGRGGACTGRHPGREGREARRHAPRRVAAVAPAPRAAAAAAAAAAAYLPIWNMPLRQRVVHDVIESNVAQNDKTDKTALTKSIQLDPK